MQYTTTESSCIGTLETGCSSSDTIVAEDQSRTDLEDDGPDIVLGEGTPVTKSSISQSCDLANSFDRVLNLFRPSITLSSAWNL